MTSGVDVSPRFIETAEREAADSGLTNRFLFVLWDGGGNVAPQLAVWSGGAFLAFRGR